MARIPRVQLNQSIPGRSGGARVGAGAFGGPARSLQRTGQALAQTGLDIVEKETALRQRNQFNKALIEFNKHSSGVEESFQRDEDFNTLPERSEKSLNEAVKNLSSGIESQELKQNFLLRANSASLSTVARAKLFRRKKTVAEASAIGIQLEDNGLDTLSRNPGMGTATLKNNVSGYYKGLVEQGVILRADADAKIAGFDERLGKIQGQQERAEVVNSGTAEELNSVINRVMAGSIPMKPEARIPFTQALVKDFVSVREKREKQQGEIVKQIQDGNEIDRLQRIPGKNQTDQPNYTFEDYQKDVDERNLTPEAERRVLTAMNRTIEEPVPFSSPDVIDEIERDISLRTGTPEEVRQTIMKFDLGIEGGPSELTTEDRTRLLDKVNRWEKELQTEEGKELNDSFKQFHQRAVSAFQTTGPLSQFVKQDEQQLLVFIQDLAESRIRKGELWQEVWADLQGKVRDGKFQFGQDVEDIVNKVRRGEVLSDEEFFLFLRFRDQKLAEKPKRTAAQQAEIDKRK